MAGAVPVVSTENDGKFISKDYSKLFCYFTTLSFTESQRYIKIVARDKSLLLFGFMGNNKGEGLFMLSTNDSNNIKRICFHEIVPSDQSEVKIRYKETEISNTFEIYIGPIQPFGRASVFALTGLVDSSALANSVPEDTTDAVKVE